MTCAKHITNDELLYTHKSQGNAFHIYTFYSKQHVIHIYTHIHTHMIRIIPMYSVVTLGMKSFSTHIYVQNKLHIIRKRQDCITLLF